MTGRILNTYILPDDELAHHDTIYASNGYVYVLTTPGIEAEDMEIDSDSPDF